MRIEFKQPSVVYGFGLTPAAKIAYRKLKEMMLLQ